MTSGQMEVVFHRLKENNIKIDLVLLPKEQTNPAFRQGLLFLRMNPISADQT